jgi:hypothetical protein
VYIKADQPVKRIPRDFSSGAPCKAEKEEYNVKYARVLPGAFLSKWDRRPSAERHFPACEGA